MRTSVVKVTRLRVRTWCSLWFPLLLLPSKANERGTEKIAGRQSLILLKVLQSSWVAIKTKQVSVCLSVCVHAQYKQEADGAKEIGSYNNYTPIKTSLISMLQSSFLLCAVLPDRKPPFPTGSWLGLSTRAQLRCLSPVSLCSPPFFLSVRFFTMPSLVIQPSQTGGAPAWHRRRSLVLAGPERRQ